MQSNMHACTPDGAASLLDLLGTGQPQAGGARPVVLAHGHDEGRGANGRQRSANVDVDLCTAMRMIWHMPHHCPSAGGVNCP